MSRFASPSWPMRLATRWLQIRRRFSARAATPAPPLALLAEQMQVLLAPERLHVRLDWRHRAGCAAVKGRPCDCAPLTRIIITERPSRFEPHSLEHVIDAREWGF